MFGYILFFISLFTVLIFSRSSHISISSLLNNLKLLLSFPTGYKFLFIKSTIYDLPDPFGPRIIIDSLILNLIFKFFIT